MQEYYTNYISNCQNKPHHGHKSNRKKLNILGGVTDIAKQSLMAAGSGLLKAKGLDSSANRAYAEHVESGLCANPRNDIEAVSYLQRKQAQTKKPRQKPEQRKELTQMTVLIRSPVLQNV